MEVVVSGDGKGAVPGQNPGELISYPLFQMDAFRLQIRLVAENTNIRYVSSGFHFPDLFIGQSQFTVDTTVSFRANSVPPVAPVAPRCQADVPGVVDHQRQRGRWAQHDADAARALPQHPRVRPEPLHRCLG